MLIFQNTLPSLGVGRLKLRGDDAHVYGTDKEHMLRLPDDPFYKQMAAEFSKFQICANVYAFSDKYTDIASLGNFLSSSPFFTSPNCIVSNDKANVFLQRLGTRRLSVDMLFFVGAAFLMAIAFIL